MMRTYLGIEEFARAQGTTDQVEPHIVELNHLFIFALRWSEDSYWSKGAGGDVNGVDRSEDDQVVGPNDALGYK
jgi:hypothetical protein